MPKLRIEKEDILLPKPSENENNKKKESKEEWEQKQEQLFHALVFKALEHQDYELVKTLLYYVYFLDAETLRQGRELAKVTRYFGICKRHANLLQSYQEIIQRYVNNEIFLTEMQKELLDQEKLWFSNEILNFQNSPMLHGNMHEINRLSDKERFDQFTFQLSKELQQINLPTIKNKKQAKKFLTRLQSDINSDIEKSEKLQNIKSKLATPLLEKQNTINKQRWEILETRLEGLNDYTQEETNELRNYVLDIKIPIDIEDSQTGNTLLHTFLLHLDKNVTYSSLQNFEWEGPISASPLQEKEEKKRQEEREKRNKERQKQQRWDYNDSSRLGWQVLRALLEYLPAKPMNRSQNKNKNENASINLTTHQNQMGKTVLDLAWDRGDTSFMLSLMNHFQCSIESFLDRPGEEKDTLLHKAMRDENEALIFHLLKHYHANLFAENEVGETSLQIALERADPHDIEFSPSYDPASPKETSTAAQRIIRALVFFTVLSQDYKHARGKSQFEMDTYDRFSQQIDLLRKQETKSAFMKYFVKIRTDLIDQQLMSIQDLMAQWGLSNLLQDDLPLFKAIEEKLETTEEQGAMHYFGLGTSLQTYQEKAVNVDDYTFGVRKATKKELEEAEKKNLDKEAEIIGREEGVIIREDEVQRRDEESRRIEEEARRREEEARRREEEARRIEEEARRIEEEARRREEEARRIEEESRRREEESRRIEEESRRERKETQRENERLRKKEAELAAREEKLKRLESQEPETNDEPIETETNGRPSQGSPTLFQAPPVVEEEEKEEEEATSPLGLGLTQNSDEE